MNNEALLENVRGQIAHLKSLNSEYYDEIYGDVNPDDIRTMDDFRKLPFVEKATLRKAYPLKLMARPEEEVVRIHSSSGTTGVPVIIPYTQKDLDDWTDMFRRCYETVGVGDKDRVQIAVGYGLWTAGASFQAGAEAAGAMAVPMGPGNSDKQIKMMMDLQSTVLCSTSSYALVLAEKIQEMELKDSISLKKCMIGSELWGKKMRERIADTLGAKLYDIYGLTELYGPGVAISCDAEAGMHYWDDYFYFEIIDPDTGENLPDGEIGELVVTTLQKEGAPLIRFRTRDLTKIIPGDCPCGCKYPRIDTLTGRTDDMFKVKGVNMFPKQVQECLEPIEGVSSEYQIIIDHLDGKDILTLYFEIEEGHNRTFVENEVATAFKTKIGISIYPNAVGLCELPRSEKKTNRIFDNRY